jgi:hypothetical protein
MHCSVSEAHNLLTACSQPPRNLPASPQKMPTYKITPRTPAKTPRPTKRSGENHGDDNRGNKAPRVSDSEEESEELCAASDNTATPPPGSGNETASDNESTSVASTPPPVSESEAPCTCSGEVSCPHGVPIDPMEQLSKLIKYMEGKQWSPDVLEAVLRNQKYEDWVKEALVQAFLNESSAMARFLRRYQKPGQTVYNAIAGFGGHVGEFAPAGYKCIIKAAYVKGLLPSIASTGFAVASGEDDEEEVVADLATRLNVYYTQAGETPLTAQQARIFTALVRGALEATE